MRKKESVEVNRYVKYDLSRHIKKFLKFYHEQLKEK